MRSPGLRLVLTASAAIFAAACAAPGDEDPGASNDAIVGGSETSDMPGVGYLGDVPKAGSFVWHGPSCTASLIAPNVILTAAHCLEEAPDTRTVFGLGKSDGRRVFDIKTVKLHPQYATKKSDGSLDPKHVDNTHDIAYAVLANAVPDTPVLGIRRGPHEGSCNYVGIGYGISTDGYKSAAPAATPTIGLRKAVPFCASEGLQREGMIAAKSTSGAVCNGDSGGPLLTSTTKELIGVVSYRLKIDACAANAPSYYAPVASNLAFIDEAIAAGGHTSSRESETSTTTAETVVSSCIPASTYELCASAREGSQIECGILSDGCGGTVDCDGVDGLGCSEGQTCNPAGRCVVPTCVPRSAADLCNERKAHDGVECGVIDDGCGGAVDCTPITEFHCPTGSRCNASSRCEKTTTAPAPVAPPAPATPAAPSSSPKQETQKTSDDAKTPPKASGSSPTHASEASEQSDAPGESETDKKKSAASEKKADAKKADDGGCAASPGGRRGGSAAAWLAIVFIVGARRRRR